jgi:hypothetical protein
MVEHDRMVYLYWSHTMQVYMVANRSQLLLPLSAQHLLFRLARRLALAHLTPVFNPSYTVPFELKNSQVLKAVSYVIGNWSEFVCQGQTLRNDKVHELKILFL